MTDETNNMGAKDSERLPSYFLKITYSRIQVLESGSGISNGELPVDSLLPLVPVLLYEKRISVYEQKRSLLFGRDRNLILNAKIILIL